jgi:hypothetical protein
MVTLETQIEINQFPNATYNVVCYDGFAIAYLHTGIGAKIVKFNYPKYSDIISDEDKTKYVLDYRGLTLTNTLTCGDIFMALGEAQKTSFALVAEVNRKNLCDDELQVLLQHSDCAIEYMLAKYSNIEQYKTIERYEQKEYIIEETGDIISMYRNINYDRL